MQKIDTSSQEWKNLSRLEQATRIWDGMKQRDPIGCAEVEVVVKRRVQTARNAGAFRRNGR